MPEFSAETIPPNLFAVPDLTFEQISHLPPSNVFLQPYWSPHIARELIMTAQALVNHRGKGIYATDESPDVIQAAFDGVKVDKRVWTEAENKERRKNWRKCAYNAISSGKCPITCQYPHINS